MTARPEWAAASLRRSERRLRPEIEALLALPVIAAREKSFDPTPVSPATRAEVVRELRAAPLATVDKVPVAEVWDFPAGDLGTSLRGYRPAVGGLLPVLIYLHGGGWVFGNLETHDAPCRVLANAARCLVVNVDYDLAPENAYPQPLANCRAVRDWVVANAAAFGGDPARVAITGASAGGNLAAALVLDGVRNDGPDVVAQALFYPVLDGTLAQPSYEQNATGYNLSAAEMRFYWDCYVQNGEDRADPLLSPLHADDLTGLPPTMVVTAEFDVLRDEGEAYAARLAGSGVPTELRRYAGQIHGFASMGAVTPDANHALAEVGAWLEGIFWD
jgi:acetyl esterase